MIVSGTILGWQTAFMLHADSARAQWRFMVAGVIGAVFSGLLLTPALTQGNLVSGTYTVDALLMTMAGALAVLIMYNYVYLRDPVEPGLD